MASAKGPGRESNHWFEDLQGDDGGEQGRAWPGGKISKIGGGRFTWDYVGHGKVFRFHAKSNMDTMKDLKQESGRTRFPFIATWGTDDKATRSHVRRPVRATVVLVTDDRGLEWGGNEDKQMHSRYILEVSCIGGRREEQAGLLGFWAKQLGGGS